MMTCASCEKIIHSFHLTNQLKQVYARTGQSSRDVSLFLVEKGTPGFSLGQKIEATWIAGGFVDASQWCCGSVYSWRNGCKHTGVDGLKFHGIASVCTLEDLGSMGVKLHDLRNSGQVWHASLHDGGTRISGETFISQVTCWGWPPPLLLPVGEVKTRHVCRLEQRKILVDGVLWQAAFCCYIKCVFFCNLWLIVLSFLGLFHVYYYYYYYLLLLLLLLLLPPPPPPPPPPLLPLLPLLLTVLSTGVYPMILYSRRIAGCLLPISLVKKVPRHEEDLNIEENSSKIGSSMSKEEDFFLNVSLIKQIFGSFWVHFCFLGWHLRLNLIDLWNNTGCFSEGAAGWNPFSILCCGQRDGPSSKGDSP